MLAGRNTNNELAEPLRRCIRAFAGAGVMSCMINILYLTGSFFMLEVYDRVVPSRSVPTLIGLCVLAAFLYGFQGLLEVLRSRVLVRVGTFVDQSLSRRIYDIIVSAPPGKNSAEAMQGARDLEQVRTFLVGPGPSAFFDLPWLPFYLGICFIFHPMIGLTAVFGALILVGVTVATDIFSRRPMAALTVDAMDRRNILEASRRNAEVVQAMGMGPRLGDLWDRSNEKYLTSQRTLADVSGGLGSISKVLRMMLQSAVLAVGAYLVVQQLASGGVIIAASILTARALAPVDLVIANWKGFLNARQSWARLRELLRQNPARAMPLTLPAPVGTVDVANVTVVPPNARRPVVSSATFSLKAGQGLGVIGPSASGKSSLARAIVGVWPAVAGSIRLDGAELDQFSPEQRGSHIGYVPQDVELFSGTIAQNIARFDPKATSEAIISASRIAGVHDLILRLPEGYSTQIGEGGAALSGGQRQRIALARALYGDPFLVVLDEPNSNLDADGERALTNAIASVRARGGIVIVVAHRPSALASVDQVLVIRDGVIQAIGPRDAVLRELASPQPAVEAASSSNASAAAGAAAQPQPVFRVVSEKQAIKA
ncbi:type I secretion protein [Alsobacter metallidurans]|uniref:Type I secretion protein n=2 Tax=Alsobacter metallidurans TaxID=340221 RepID=A0A917MHV0_9HYPH|nr:type I secretion system permease/ATPase [Alsobacter metallidurans]GGH17204.1 type I secretion protein [Alsobacter metallidurans]